MNVELEELAALLEATHRAAIEAVINRYRPVHAHYWRDVLASRLAAMPEAAALMARVGERLVESRVDANRRE